MRTIDEIEADWAKEKDIIERKNKIELEKKAIKPKKITTTKLLLLFLFLNCTAIEIFTGWVTIQEIIIAKNSYTYSNIDFSPLVTLIGAVVGEVIGFAVYALKSIKENTKNGIIYDTAMHKINNETVG